ncbi:MAG: M28 family peptidase [Myxococcales bacterium]|nr:M28 family peptidase [Myxococcales bacterium]
MRALARGALALAVAACADDAPGDGPDAAATCRAPTAAPAWLDGYLATTIAKLSGAADVAPGVRLADRATVARRAAAQRFALDELAAAGLPAALDDYGTGANVTAELPATAAAPGPLVLVGAHLDSVAGSPGADDNASGAAAVLATARMLTEVACRDRPVRFVLFDQEEVGLIGSTYLASALRQAGTAVAAVHTVDQIGWDGDGDRRLEIEQPTAARLAEYQAAATTLGLAVTATASGRTDHVAFREAGFDAVGVSEEFTGGDATPHYHAATDTAATLDLPFVALGARLVALVIAREVGAP